MTSRDPNRGTFSTSQIYFIYLFYLNKKTSLMINQNDQQVVMLEGNIPFYTQLAAF